MKSTVYYPLTILAGFLTFTKATPLPVDNLTDLKQCAGQWYNPSSYTCRIGADSEALCPVINGEPMDECAGACYTPLRYRLISCFWKLNIY
jgi:hypothetical protein